MKTQISLGSKTKDNITGFEGIITARAEYLNGCVRFLVQPQKLNKDGEIIKSQWIDAGQLEIVKVDTDAEEEIEFQEAREIMRKNILYRNEDLYTHYQTKVAMTLYDEQNRNNGNCLIDFSELENRNRVADKVLKAIFSKGGSNE